MSDASKPWEQKVTCTSTWSFGVSSYLIVNNADTKVYTAVQITDGGTITWFFTTFGFVSGSVDGSRYKLSVDCSDITLMAEQNSNIYYSISGTNNYIAVFYPSNSSFGTIYSMTNGIRMTSYTADSR